MLPIPDLSVVVGTVGELTLRRTLASIAASAQEGGVETEVLVVWQGPDEPPAFDGLADVVAVRRLGLSHARNEGLARAAAPVVAFVDADEVVMPGWARAVVTALAPADGRVAAFGPVEPLDEVGIPYCHVTGSERRRFEHPRVSPWEVGTGGNMAFRRDHLAALGGFDLGLGAGGPGRAAEDTEIIRRLLLRGDLVVWEPDMGVMHPTKTTAESLSARYPYGYGMGRAIRITRDLWLLRRYCSSMAHSWREAAMTRDGDRLRELAHTTAGFLAGIARPGEPERATLAPAPAEGAHDAGGVTTI